MAGDQGSVGLNFFSNIMTDFVESAAVALRTLQSNIKDDKDATIWLVLGLIKPAYSPSFKPIRINIPFPFVDLNSIRVCVFVKDPSATYKEHFAKAGVKCITKIISISSLKRKYNTFEAKRRLCASFDLFLADSCILPLLPKLLGRTFFVSKKLPLPMELSPNSPIESATSRITDTLKATYLNMNNGPCISIKAGLSSQPPKELKDNIDAIMKRLQAVLPNGGLQNIRSIHLKTSDSPSIPVLTSTINTD
jgi:ribosome biogenesis protein UTP30